MHAHLVQQMSQCPSDTCSHCKGSQNKLDTVVWLSPRSIEFGLFVNTIQFKKSKLQNEEPQLVGIPVKEK